MLKGCLIQSISFIKKNSDNVELAPFPVLTTKSTNHVLSLMVQSPELRRPDKVRELYQGQHSLVASRRRRRGVSSARRQVGKLYSLPCSRGGKSQGLLPANSSSRPWLAVRSHCTSARTVDCQSEKYSGFPLCRTWHPQNLLSISKQ